MAQRFNNQHQEARTSTKLTSPDLIRLVYHPAPEPLQPFITTLFTLRCDETEIRDVLPAAVGYLVVMLNGDGTLRFADGTQGTSFPELVLTPTTAAVEVDVAGPWAMIGAALSPLGWAALTGLHAGDHRDRIYDAGTLLGPAVQELGATLRSSTANDEDMAAMLAGFIGPRLKVPPPDRIAMMKHVGDWLSSAFDPPVADLVARMGYSERQVQRLVERYFGASPKQLARKYRALRVAALLQADDTSDARLAEVTNLFFDQPHMIRELRHFLGRTPSRLKSDANPLLAATSGVRGYREVRPNFARIPNES